MCKTHATLQIQQKENRKNARNPGPESLLNRKDTFDVLSYNGNFIPLLLLSH